MSPGLGPYRPLLWTSLVLVLMLIPALMSALMLMLVLVLVLSVLVLMLSLLVLVLVLVLLVLLVLLLLRRLPRHATAVVVPAVSFDLGASRAFNAGPGVGPMSIVVKR